ncbi:MAG: PAS domain S-box protein, partial [Verrucomicrobia bacterium]|nr:PAS domain S-box protein [Verrucomicrobiota bacterium]
MYFWFSFMRKPTRSTAGPVLGREPRDCDRGDDSRILLAIVDDVVAEGIVVGDRSGNLIYCNQRWIDIWQIPPRLLTDGKLSPIWEFTARYFVDPDNYLHRIRGIEQAPAEQLDLLELRDGRRLERIFTSRLTHGQGVYGVWSFRSAAEREPSDVIAHRLAAIVDNSTDAIVGKDLNGIVTSWNAGAERIFGYAADEMIGTSIMRLIPAERQAEEDMILSRIRSGIRVDHFETRRLTKSGREIHASITVSPIKDASGKVIGASKIARDITERKLTEEAVH